MPVNSSQLWKTGHWGHVSRAKDTKLVGWIKEVCVNVIVVTILPLTTSLMRGTTRIRRIDTKRCLFYCSLKKLPQEATLSWTTALEGQSLPLIGWNLLDGRILDV